MEYGIVYCLTCVPHVMIYVMLFPRKRFFAYVAFEWRISSVPKINIANLKTLQQTKPTDILKNSILTF